LRERAAGAFFFGAARGAPAFDVLGELLDDLLD
jgi:hypothetical protein